MGDDCAADAGGDAPSDRSGWQPAKDLRAMYYKISLLVFSEDRLWWATTALRMLAVSLLATGAGGCLLFRSSRP